MEGISDIKIIGIDEKRPSVVRKEPYIDIYFKLSHQAPEDWCEDFNDLTRNLTPTVKIKKAQGLFIETYVREMGEIAEHLERIKKIIEQCSAQYLERIRQKAAVDAAKNVGIQGEGGEQGKLNAIIEGLNYDD